MTSITSFQGHYGLADVVEGQRQIAAALKSHVRSVEPDLVARLEGEDDWAFLEPLLFAHLASARADEHPAADANVPLAQLLVGYLPAARRPAHLTVRSDSAGRIHLPNLGYLLTDRPARQLRLSWSEGCGHWLLFDHEEVIAHRFEPPLCLRETGVELLPYGHQLFQGQYRDPEGTQREIVVEGPTRRSVEHVERAFTLLRDACPEYYTEVMAVARAIIVFESPAVRPFVSPSAHGAVFLSTRPEDDEIFFVTELVHQFGHNIFNAVLCDASAWLTVPPYTPAREFTVAHDRRSLASAFHGLYTTTRVALCLEALLARDVHTPRQRHELLGRLADNRERISTGFEKSDLSRCFTARGQALYHAMKQMCHDVYRRQVGQVGRLDTSNQPFVFDYDLFARTNPMPSTTA